jgi:hypothetical protein
MPALHFAHGAGTEQLVDPLRQCRPAPSIIKQCVTSPKPALHGRKPSRSTRSHARPTTLLDYDAPANGRPRNNRSGKQPRRRAAAMRNRIPLSQKRLCVDLVHEDEWELDGTDCNLSHRQPLRGGFAERTLATPSAIIRTYGGCRPCHGSSKLRSRNAQPMPPP